MTPSPAKMMAKNLAGRLNTWDEQSQHECPIDDILYKPYANLNFRKDTISQFLQLLTPQNCYIIHRDQAYKNESDLKTEEIYGTQFKVEKFDQAKLEEWSKATCKPSEKLGYPAKNSFMPQRTPESIKLAKPADQEPAKPALIRSSSD